MPVLESAVERRVVYWAKQQGIPAPKFGQQGGWPDRIFLIPGGRPVLIEFKRLGQAPTKLQYYRLRILKQLGYDAVWSNTYEEAVQYIQSRIIYSQTS